ncbi:MAG: ribosome biogenesis GTPase Der [Gammaproteobacteria bacterium]
MLPVIALVGRPNVGKSTLFNRLTRTRDAIVADQPGVTRDRRYGRGKLGKLPYLVIDTGGLSGDESGIDAAMAVQTSAAIDEADAIVFIVDGREGVTAADEMIAQRLRATEKPMLLLVNKTDGVHAETAAADFYSLGLTSEPLPIAAAHGRGVQPAIDRLLREFKGWVDEEESEADESEIKIAIVGRPNVGKSTLVNRLVGEERVVTFDHPGTTRDSIDVPFERDGKQYTLIDTAGVRRRARVKEELEKFSVIKALQAVERANVVIMVIDGREGVSDQDATLLGYIVEEGRALVLAMNKWDGLTREARDHARRTLDLKLPFIDFAELHFISALHGTGVGDLMGSVRKAHASATRSLKTQKLTEILEEAVMEHQPKLVRGRRIKLRYAHQGGRNPPIIVIHGNQTDEVPDDYKRYLEKRYRQRLHLVGTPIRIQFKGHENPYEGKKNTLTKRQVEKKKRLIKFVKRRR